MFYSAVSDLKTYVYKLERANIENLSSISKKGFLAQNFLDLSYSTSSLSHYYIVVYPRIESAIEAFKDRHKPALTNAAAIRENVQIDFISKLIGDENTCWKFYQLCKASNHL